MSEHQSVMNKIMWRAVIILCWGLVATYGGISMWLQWHLGIGQSYPSDQYVIYAGCIVGALAVVLGATLVAKGINHSW